MKYIMIVLMVLMVTTGCTNNFKSDLDNLTNSTNKLYFNAGYICATCEEIKRNPENFKDGTLEKQAETCKQFKDFETFNKIYKEGMFHE